MIMTQAKTGSVQEFAPRNEVRPREVRTRRGWETIKDAPPPIRVWIACLDCGENTLQGEACPACSLLDIKA